MSAVVCPYGGIVVSRKRRAWLASTCSNGDACKCREAEGGAEPMAVSVLRKEKE